MTIGTAKSIFADLGREDYTKSDKLEAIARVASSHREAERIPRPHWVAAVRFLLEVYCSEGITGITQNGQR